MMRDTSESDATSIAQSSSSSPAAAYYVQSPSRDSHDEADKCSSSNGHSTYESPSYPRSSMASNTSTAASRVMGNRRKYNKQHYHQVVNEEGKADDEYRREVYGDCRCLYWLLAFCIVFGGFCVVFWGASRPFKAQVAVKVRASCSMFTTRKFYLLCFAPPKCCYFLGCHPGPTSLYGTGPDLVDSDRSGGIPLKLEFDIHSIGHLVGKLVKTKHTRHISCSLLVNSKQTIEIIFERQSCKYS